MGLWPHFEGLEKFAMADCFISMNLDKLVLPEMPPRNDEDSY